MLRPFAGGFSIFLSGGNQPLLRRTFVSFCYKKYDFIAH